MTLKLKLLLIAILLIVVTVASVGFLGYRESKEEIKKLARDLLISKTDKAFALCEHHLGGSGEPSDELKSEIDAVKIAENGYIFVFSNEEGPDKGRMIIHPTDVGTMLYNDKFAHIKAVIDEIEEHGKIHGYDNFTYYRQGTNAKGRQGEKKIGHFKYFKPWNWVILSTGYEKDVFSSRDQLRATLIPLVLLIMSVGVAVVYLSIARIFKPIQRLTESTKEVAKGNWDISINYKSNDEIGALAQSFDRMVTSLRENARMWHEFNVAREMQAQMLPETFPQIDGLDISATSIPTKEVGGDFYDFLTLAEDRLGLVIGDVSGHGVSAAMVMTAAMGAVRFAAEEKESTDAVLNMVNARLNKDIQANMFVALFYGIYDARTRKLYYTNAGQTMPYLLRAGKLQFLPQAEDSDRFPLGIVKDTVYEQMCIELEKDDILVFYTDGIVDAMNGSSESYGFDRFSASIKENTAAPDEMLEKLVDGMRQYSGHSSVHDDVTLVILKIN